MQKRIAYITDTHLDEDSVLQRGIDPRKNLLEILERLSEDQVDEIVFGGDIGEKEAYQWLFEKLETYKPGFRLTLGNHDDPEHAKKYYRNFTTAGEDGLYYATEDEYYKYLYLDSSSGEISKKQLQWVEQELNTLKKPVVFIHHPVLAVNTAIDLKYPLQNRSEVAEALQQSRHAVTLFCGHYHMPDKKTEGKITQYITPAVSFQVKKFAPEMDIKTDMFGFRIITLHESSVKSSLVTNRYDGFSSIL